MTGFRRIVLATGIVIGLVLSPLQVMAQQLTAQESVDKYVSGLLVRMKEIKPLYESDRQAYFREVEKALSNFVDFREVARGVMAKYGTGPNGATDAQLDRFAEVFKASVVDFYGSALAEYGGAKYEFIENSRPPKDPEKATNVRMSVLGDDGNRIDVQYVMFLNDQKIWKVKNLYVEGVNLRRQYYSRFDDLMQRNNFDIDKVIDMWTAAG